MVLLILIHVLAMAIPIFEEKKTRKLEFKNIANNRLLLRIGAMYIIHR